MGIYAKVRDGLVVNVIVADDEFFETFVDDTPGTYIETKKRWIYKKKLCRNRIFL